MLFLRFLHFLLQFKTILKISLSRCSRNMSEQKRPLCTVYFLPVFLFWLEVSSLHGTANAYFSRSVNTTNKANLINLQLPSDPCWPSTDEWSSLNETPSGRLIRTVPLASVCYPAEPNHNTKACESILSNWTTSAFYAAEPASTGDLTWTDSSCLPPYPNRTSTGGIRMRGKMAARLGISRCMLLMRLRLGMCRLRWGLRESIIFGLMLRIRGIIRRRGLFLLDIYLGLGGSRANWV